MIVLALDTALDACSVAIVRDDAMLAARSERMARGQAERLTTMVQEVIAEAGVSFTHIDRIVATVGPGSFTGVRVGLSFARALALALDKPCVGVSTLEALALEQGTDGLRAALVETQGAAFAALYADGAPLLAPCAVERADADAVLCRAANGAPFQLTGPGAVPDIAALARRAARLDPATHPPSPLYLRDHGARLPGGVAP